MEEWKTSINISQMSHKETLFCLAHLPVKFWGESILAAAHVINRTPSAVLHGKTPYELLYVTIATYDDIKVFGSSKPGCSIHITVRRHYRVLVICAQNIMGQRRVW